MKTRIAVNKDSEVSALKLGAKYDGRMKSWYVPQDVPITLFTDFIPLSIELVPSTMWKQNVRSEHARDWDTYRRNAYSMAGHTCEVCGANNQALEAHEEWEFDNMNRIQKLKKIVCLCYLCHRTKHWGLAVSLGEEELVRNHIMKINRWKSEDVDKYLIEVFLIFEMRSRCDWKLDLSALNNIFLYR